MDQAELSTTERKPVNHISDRPRFKTVLLDWPVEHDGKTYTEVTVRRMTTAEVRSFLEAIEQDGDRATLPMFDVPADVLDGLDDDDAMRLNEAVSDFLPLRLRGTAGQSPPPGESTLPSQQQPSTSDQPSS